MMKVIVYRRPDGGVSICNPAPKYVAQLMAGGMTEDEAITAIQAKDVPNDAADIEVVEKTSIPPSRYFRDAWVRSFGDAPIDVDMVKARVIKTKKVQAEISERFVQARDDLETAEDSNNITEQARIRTRRKALRDLPDAIQPDLDAITTPEALEAWQPTWPV